MNVRVEGHIEKVNRVVDQIPVVSLREGQVLEAQVELLPATQEPWRELAGVANALHTGRNT